MPPNLPGKPRYYTESDGGPSRIELLPVECYIAHVGRCTALKPFKGLINNMEHWSTTAAASRPNTGKNWFCLDQVTKSARMDDQECY